MAKRSKPHASAKRKAKGAMPPSLTWKQDHRGYHPIVTIGNIVIRQDPRPFKGFIRGEREYILLSIKQVMSEVLFGHPRYLADAQGKIVAENPDWGLLPVFINDEVNGEWIEVEERPSADQVQAGNQLQR